jgi:SWI/SNF-related matrix-associated actin-dependent regulator of chromatin subfamily A-like protein 1
MNTPTDSAAVILIAPTGGDSISIKPLDYLGPEQFSRYINACRAAGARYMPNLRAQVGPLDRLGDVVANLKDAGFHVQLDDTIAAAFTAQIATIRAASTAILETIDDVVAELAARGKQLWKFQLEGVAWLRSKYAALLGDDMGLGKTVQALVALPPKSPTIVMCPAAVKGSWVREIATWRPDLFPSVRSGRGNFRWPLPGEVVIINYDILPEHVHGAPRPGTVLIADEAHALKSKKTHRTQRFRAIAAAVRLVDQGRVWLMTGTPILNRAPELWTLLDIIGLATEAFGSWPEFNRIFGAVKTDYGMKYNGPALEAGERLRKVMLRRRRTEVLPDLPTKTHVDISAPIDDLTRRLADEAWAEMQRKLAERGISLEAALENSKLPVVFELMSKVRAALATAKIPAMLEQLEAIEETGEPQLVFSAHRAPIDLLEDRPGWAVITGDTSPDRRSSIVRDFQDGRLKGIGVTVKAGGVGLTLTRAHQALFVDLEWTPALNCQAEDRICRIGQDRGCIIRRLIAAHEMEERVAKKLLEKQLLIDGSVERAAVGEGQSTIANDAAARQLEGLLAQVVVGAASADGLRKAHPAAVAPVPAADECPF